MQIDMVGAIKSSSGQKVNKYFVTETTLSWVIGHWLGESMSHNRVFLTQGKWNNLEKIMTPSYTEASEKLLQTKMSWKHPQEGALYWKVGLSARRRLPFLGQWYARMWGPGRLREQRGHEQNGNTVVAASNTSDLPTETAYAKTQREFKCPAFPFSSPRSLVCGKASKRKAILMLIPARKAELKS